MKRLRQYQPDVNAGGVFNFSLHPARILSHLNIEVNYIDVNTKKNPGTESRAITRLMSPADFGRLLKPYVFFDLIDNGGKPFAGFGLHPHSGIATLTYVAEGSVTYEDTNGATGLLRAGGIEWMRAGGGVWHGGGLGEPGRTRGFQLWIALPPELELGTSESVYLAPDAVPHEGPASVLLGSYGAATSPIQTPSPMNYLAVRLKAGERWSYQPPAGHTILWTAIGKGFVRTPDELQEGELAAFTPGSGAIESRPKPMRSSCRGRLSHEYELVLDSHSVHTNSKARREAETWISEIEAGLI